MREARETCGTDEESDESVPPEKPAKKRSGSKQDPDWNYNEIRTDFIKIYREAGCKYSEAKEAWDESEEKKSLLGPLTLPELKRRRFVDKSCEANPWAWSLAWGNFLVKT